MTAIRYRGSALLEMNIQEHLEREFINAGQYSTITSGYFTANGEQADLLTMVNPTYWQSFFSKWVGDTDHAGCAGFETILASGVFIDGVFHARGSAPHEPAIDYENGAVAFEGTAPSTSATVTAEFSFPKVTFATPDTDIVNFLFSPVRDNENVTTAPIPSGLSRQLPVVIIDPQVKDSFPSQIGGGQRVNQRVVFHIVANNRTDVDQIVDLLQEFSYRDTIQGVNFNSAPQQFTESGDRASTYVNYTNLQASGSIAWSKIFVEETRLVERDVLNQYHRERS
jgi:uncharacterized protein YlbG (UPF0298 family)